MRIAMISNENSDEPVKKKLRVSNDCASNEETEENKLAKMEQKPCKVRVRKKPVPKFRLITTGVNASLDTSSQDRVPLTLTDVQHLLLHSLLGNLNLSQSPRWYVLDKCNNIKQTTCLIVEGISVKHWEMYKETLSKTKTLFENVVEVLTPSVYGGSLVTELALVPLSESDKESLIQKYGSMNLALQVRKDLNVMMKAVFPIGNQEPDTFDETTLEEKFPRTQLVLSAWQLIEENYPVPLRGKLKTIYADYVLSKEEYQPVTATSPMFGVDCEMCQTEAGSELTRISIVNENHETVYEALVKPFNKITDYLTRYSGITKNLLENVTKRLQDVQSDLRELLPPDAILVGHSLQSDLHALKMMHPYIIDTSTIYNFTCERLRKPKLKVLAKEFLKQDIQNGKNGHCSVEDSLAAIKLVQLKLSRSIEFGDAIHTSRQKYKENAYKKSVQTQYAVSIFNHIIDQKKTSIVIGCDNITGDYHTFLTLAKENVSNQLKKAKSKKVKLNTVDRMEDVISSIIESGDSYNLVMGHLKVDPDEINEELMKTIDEWVQQILSSVPDSSLCSIVFGGTTTDNGVAMVRVKNTV